MLLVLSPRSRRFSSRTPSVMLSPNAVALFGLSLPKSKSAGVCDDGPVEPLLLPPQPAAARRAIPRQTSRTRRWVGVMIHFRR